ncbi:MAG TPA: 50S ribosomal protein L25 [Candidatus Elarobacter sp.]|jgi:large subunit ribosomal protein L25|nr:50S ribosomal protein L25 [Candidatus Elarobacter sp.]
MSKHTLNTVTLETRTDLGKTGAHRLRAQGKIPGVVYGHGTSTPITIDAKELTELILSGNRHHVVDATIGGAPDSVLLRSIETHPITRKPLSVDFQRIASGESITSTVPVTTSGTPAGVRDSGGVMEIVAHTLDVKGPAQSMPDHLTVDVTNLGLYEHVTAGDVPLPSGFTLLTPPETVVITVGISRASVGAGTDNEDVQPTEAPTGE